jgi:chromosome segregation ATPase
MRLASRFLNLLFIIILFSSCADKSGLKEIIIDLEQEVKKTRTEAIELKKRISELETRLEKMYEETEKQSDMIDETGNKLH